VRRIGVVLTVGLLAVLSARGAGGDVLQDLGATFQQVAQTLAQAFPKVDARVVAVEGEYVVLDGSGVEELRPGLELTAYRRGEVFRHPVTGQPLGHTEQELATLVVTTVEGRQARARPAPGATGTPVVGDQARITAGRLNVAVLPPTGVSTSYETADQAALLLVARFSALLEKTGRFVTAEPRKVLEVAGFGATTPPATPLDLAQKLGVPAVLTVRLSGTGRERVLDVAWVSGKTGSELWSTRTSLAKAVLTPRFAWEVTPEIERSFSIEGPVRGVAIADLDGDQRPELILGDERAVSVYRWQEGVGPSLQPGLVFRPGGMILSVDAADLTGSGRAQIVVVDYQSEAGIPRGTVLELVGQELKPVYETRGFLRVVRLGREAWLVEQDSGRREIFEGPIRRLVADGGRYRFGESLRVPPDVNLYGLALMRLSGGEEPDVVALTGNDRLGVWTAAGRRLWTSADRFGGPAVTFAANVVGRDVALSTEGSSLVGRVRGRVIPLMGEAVEGPELLVFENILPLGQVTAYLPGAGSILYTQGRIHRLRWKDGAFARVWQSAVTAGYITDFSYGDLDGDGAPEVAVGVIPRGFNLDALNPFTRGRSRLVLYELP
jgi:hypothetical protein